VSKTQRDDEGAARAIRTPADRNGKSTLAYTTGMGQAYQGDSRDLLRSKSIKPGSVDLLMMSPPFALTRKKDYGNESATEYIDWFLTFVEPFSRVLSDTGSLVIDIGGAYLPGRPQRSTYHFQLVVELAKHFELCQEFYWYNPAKLLKSGYQYSGPAVRPRYLTQVHEAPRWCHTSQPPWPSG
jgi:hypothetical protein